jgi:uncharacterized protein YndB with AHSA1/START domain
MPDILHRVGIARPPAEVYRALTTLDGLSHWWIAGTKGSAKVGGVLKFGVEGGGFHMKVLASRPGKLVQWRCIAGPDEWLGTELTFKLVGKEGQTFVVFTHAGWEKPVEFMHHCSTKWAIFLMSLKDWVERAEAHAHPYDVKIHVGD